MTRFQRWARFFLPLIILLSACMGRFPSQQDDRSTEATRVVVRILNLDAVLTSTSTTKQALVQTPTPTIPSLPESTPPPTITLEPSKSKTAESTSPPQPSCINRAEFVAHLSISDNTALQSAQPFAKIWRIRNTGTCVWTEEYALVFFAGEQMNGPESVNLSKTVLPGETVDIRVNLLAPTAPDAHTGFWAFRDASGNLFGAGQNADQPIWVTIWVKPTPKPPPS